jgi:hypothetical protein
VTPALNDVGRNRLHNAGFGINQRGYTSGAALGAGAYGHDRWKAGSGGCTYTFTQSQPFTTITITAGSLQQIVEAQSVEGGTYTLSWTGTTQGRVNAGSYAASPVTVAGLAVNTAITIEFNAGTLGRVQFELGSVATPLEKPDPRYDLANCQRFYQIVSTSLRTAAANVGAYYENTVNWPSMRATPTVTLSLAGGTINTSSVFLTAASVNGGRFGFVSSAATGDVYALQYLYALSADL